MAGPAAADRGPERSPDRIVQTEAATAVAVAVPAVAAAEVVVVAVLAAEAVVASAAVVAAEDTAFSFVWRGSLPVLRCLLSGRLRFRSRPLFREGFCVRAPAPHMFPASKPTSILGSWTRRKSNP